MTDPISTEDTRPLCLGCGKPMMKGTGFCHECVDRGLGPCEVCEGLPLDEVEE